MLINEFVVKEKIIKEVERLLYKYTEPGVSEDTIYEYNFMEILSDLKVELDKILK